MKSFLDTLLGPDDVGWLKTALLSGFIGMGIAYLIDPTVFEAGGSNKWYFILLGYPVQLIIRRWYQHHYMRPKTGWEAALAESEERMRQRFGRKLTPEEWERLAQMKKEREQGPPRT